MSGSRFADERRRKQTPTLSNPSNSILGPRNQCSILKLGSSGLVALGTGGSLWTLTDLPTPLLFRLVSSSEQTEKLVTSLGAPAVVIELRHQVFALS